MSDATTILIVEDEAIVAADLEGKLRRLGYEIAGTAAEGEEAVELSLRLRPDLVLMDIRLKGSMDGIEAAEAIRRRHDVPVIYLTAHSDAATLARAKLTGPFGYILKPFEERELLTQIELALFKYQAERQLREQREWLHVTLTSIGDAVIATDAGGRITFINPVAEALTCWKAEDASGRTLATVFRIVNEQTGEALEEPVGLVLREGRPVTIANHAALVTRDGRTVPIEDSAAPILDAGGKVIGAVLVFHDVTEKRRAEEALRESEEKFRSAFANAAIGFAMTGPDGRFVDANPAYRALTGYNIDELRNLEFPQLLHPEDLPGNMRLIDRMFSGEIPDFVVENRYVRKDKEPVWVRKSVSLVRDADASPRWIIALVEDITTRKQAEEGLQKAHTQLQDHARRLQETNRDLEGFAYTVSHDLRTPLRAINGFARMLVEDYGQSLEEEARRRLAVIETNAVRMGMLIDDLLAFSRAGRTAMSVLRIDMNSLVSEVVETLKSTDGRPKAGIHVAALPRAQGDPALIRQVIANLLQNAVKFSRKNPEPRVEVGSFRQDGEPVYFVKDNGVGFDMKYYGKLFRVFQRLVSDKEFEGTGVGLAIVHRLVTRHGGRVWAEAKPGEGATFFFTLKVNAEGNPECVIQSAE